MIQFYKALADETRLQIIGIMSMGEFSVQEITRILNMGQSRISRHLKILSDAGIAESRRDGARVFYRNDSMASGHLAKVMKQTIEWLKDSDEWEPLKTAVEEILEWRRSKSRSFFSEVGQDWPSILERFVEQDVFIRELSRNLEGIDVLADLGCGPGHLIRHISETVPYIIGVDYSIRMLDLARNNLRDLVSRGHVDLRLGALEHLPMKDGEVDGVLVTLVLHHLAEPAAVFREFIRVIAPGGTVTIVDFKQHDHEHFRDEMADLWLGFDPRDLKNWLIETGFNHVNVQDFPGGKDDINLIIASGRKSG
ncbi:MAG TPA: metalloregulator ArsR/SmtB family transcription factor [bacterium]|nr:metalloregulator ArsR/SmtB family transcription factor [bacterium]